MCCRAWNKLAICSELPGTAFNLKWITNVLANKVRKAPIVSVASRRSEDQRRIGEETGKSLENKIKENYFGNLDACPQRFYEFPTESTLS